MRTRRPAFLTLALLATACSSASTSPSAVVDPPPGPTGVAGIAVPAEISAIPTSGSGNGTTSASPLAARALPAMAADSDYLTAPVRRYVQERAVAQFDILNTIFSAMGQTHYADPANVGTGPYRAMVSWVEDKGKQVIPWVVESSMSTEGGADVNLVKVWMHQVMGDGQSHLIRVLVRIYQAPTVNADGSYADYGVWKLHARFGETAAEGTFVAEATRGDAGESVIQLNQLDPGGEVVRGVLHKAAASGYGKVSFPDWEACSGGGCTGLPPQATVTYVYDAGQVSLRKETAGGATVAAVKDRTAPVPVVTRYGLFEAESGDEAARHFGKTFGFPFRYTVGNVEAWGSYGAWQGRHQIWTNGAPLGGGVPVTRADVPPDQAPTFTTTPRYLGTLVRRSLEPSTLAALEGAAVNTWENRQLQMTFDGSAWAICWDPQWGQGPQPTCSATQTLAEAALDQILPPPSDPLRSAWLNACGALGCTQVAFDPAGATGPGLYVAVPGEKGAPVPTAERWAAAQGATVGGGINGQAWIVWTGTTWLKKQVVDFDPNTWTPTFGPDDQPYLFPQGAELYLNRNGASWVVRYDGTSYDVRLERQTAANPGNLAAVVPAGAVFHRMWGDTQSALTFDADPASQTFLKLLQGTAVVQQGEFGLRATVGGVVLPDQYSWDWPQDASQGWAAQQFLVDSGGALRLLSDPIQLRPIALQERGGATVSYALAFDGNWVNGLPDLWQDLQASGYQMTPEIAARVVRIPDGQATQDVAGNAYLWKALEVQEYLPVISGGQLADLTGASALSLEGLPAYVDGGVGAEPPAALRYVEGEPVTP